MSVMSIEARRHEVPDMAAPTATARSCRALQCKTQFSCQLPLGPRQLNMSMTTKQASATIAMAGAVAEAVREAGSIPAGHVYAVLCGSMNASTFDQLVATLGRAGLVSREGDLLKWVGPVLA